MITAKRSRESDDLGRFLQSSVGGELIPGDGIMSDFRLRIEENFNLGALIGSIQNFYNVRGYQQPNPDELHFIKNHQRRTVYLTTKGQNAFVTVSNPDAR